MTTRIGICQRYIPYDHRPNHCTGARLKSLSAPHDVTGVPPMMTRAVPATGNAANQPGYGMSSLMVQARSKTSPRPTQVIEDAIHLGMERKCRALTAMR